MYEFFAETFWFWADPARAVPGLVIVGALLLWTRWRRLGRTVVTLGALMLFAVATLPLARWIAAPLEHRYAPFDPASFASVDGIIVLGAGAAVTSKLTALPVVEASGERLLKLMELGERYPRAVLVFTGGGTPRPNDARTEAEIARDDLAALHFDVSRLVLEDQSLNTYENAVFTKRLVKPQPGETWLLITSGIHMPRSIGAFEGEGWDVIPVPVEYLYPRGAEFELTFDPVRRFIALSRIVHEWIGLVAYRVLGRSKDLFPPSRTVP
jgi:uncharacterized SAM-binding protein YcdF (DUF218 family)